MKKLINVLVVFLMLLMASSAWAAGTITGVQDITSRDTVRQIVYTVTFGADASAPATVALDNIRRADGTLLSSVAGWWLLEVSVLYGSTGPTDNTDMYLYRAEGVNKIDVLGGNGVNAVDNAANNTFNPATTTRPLLGTELISFVNQAVNNATCTVVFMLYR